MLYLIHKAEDKKYVENKIVPQLKDTPYSMVAFTTITELEWTEEDALLTYLPDESLRNFIPKVAESKIRIGILPHPGMRYVALSLGLSSNTTEIINAILLNEETHSLDLLCCNDKLVFQSVNIGEIFELEGEKRRKGFYSQAFHLFKQLRKLPFLHHTLFTISINGEKIIDTSAVGIVAAEHSDSYIVAKRLISKDLNHDGLFHLLIISPQHITQLIGFLFRSLLPSSKTIKKTPSFIGHIKASNVRVTGVAPIKYTVDGQKYEAKVIDFKISPLPLRLVKASKTRELVSKESRNQSLKIDKLPTGDKRMQLSKLSLPWLRRASFEEFQDLFKVLRENAVLNNAYLVMMVLSTLITAFGLYADSSPVIIGGMILAPLISPIVSFSMGVVRYDVGMLKSSLKTIAYGTLATLIFASGVSLVIPMEIVTSEISARLSPTLLDLGIAVASGIAAAYAHAKEGIAKSLAGVAIAVALVPPLVVAGIGIGWWNWEIFSGAFLLYLTNLSGIIMFAGLTFLLLGFAPFKHAKKGLMYSLLIMILVCIPLSFAFNRIKQEAEITKALEGFKIEDVTLREVRVRYGTPSIVSFRLVGPQSIEDLEMKKIKHLIEEKVGRKIRLEVSTAIEF